MQYTMYSQQPMQMQYQQQMMQQQQQQQQQQWGAWDQRQQQAPQGGDDREECRNFKRGMCDRGDRCRYAHVGGGGDRGGYGGGGGRGPRRPLGEPCKNICVRNIPYAFRDDDLLELVSVYGKTARHTVWVDPVSKRPKGFGLVEFEELDAAVAAVAGLSGREVTGGNGMPLRIHVEYSYPRNDARRPAAEGPVATGEVAEVAKHIRRALQKKGEAEPHGLTSMPLDRLQAYLDFLGGPVPEDEQPEKGEAAAAAEELAPKEEAPES